MCTGLSHSGTCVIKIISCNIRSKDSHFIWKLALSLLFKNRSAVKGRKMQAVNGEAPSCNHFCSGNSNTITYSESVSVVLVIEHAIRVHRFFIHGLSDSTVFSHQICLKHFSLYEEFSHYRECTKVFRQCTCYSCHILIELEFSRQIVEKSSIRFYDNPSCKSCNSPRGPRNGKTDRHEEAKAALPHFAKGLKTKLMMIQIHPVCTLTPCSRYNSDTSSLYPHTLQSIQFIAR
jgi:hypothetical protein